MALATANEALHLLDDEGPRARPSTHELQAFLRTTTLLGVLGEEELRGISGKLDWLSVPGGELLVRQGEVGDCVYVLVSGRLRATCIDEDGEARSLGDVGPGECVGEMALLTSEPRVATVRAVRDSELVRLSKAAFDRLVTTHPEAVMRLTRTIVARLQRSSHARPRPAPLATVALVPLHAGLDLAGFTQDLARSLSRHVATLQLDAALVDTHLGAGAAAEPIEGARHGRVLEWLNAQEQRAQLVVYRADQPSGAWTRRCLRQADRVLLVADAARLGAAIPAEIMAHGDRTNVRRELVLLHAPDTRRPSRTEAWLERLHVDAHHHVRLGWPDDAERLARRLTGRSIGLVLGGGGARAFAHIGVLRAIREAGLGVDLVGGTSMGAVIAAQFALGWGDGELLTRNRRAWVHHRPLNDYTLPVVSVLRGAKVVRLLRRLFGETRIEDLWLPYFCVSSNLTRAEAAVHRRGLLRRSVRASISIPGVGPPHVDAGELHVDGAILDNLPTAPMRAFEPGRILAVDVGQDDSLSLSSELREYPSAWQVLASRFSGRERLPGLFDILYRAALLASTQASARSRREADLCLTPKVGHFGTLQFEAIEQIVEAGYQCAREQLGPWLAAHPQLKELPR